MWEVLKCGSAAVLKCGRGSEIRTVQDLGRAITPAFGTGLWREREERVLRLRLVEGMTLRECAAQFGVTRERIRQIEAKALRKWMQNGGGR